MQITIITSPFGSIPPNAIGAVEILWYNIAKSMSVSGHNMCLISRRFNDSDKSGLNNDGINVRYIKGYSRKNNIYQDLFYDLLYSFRALMQVENTDILVLNTFWAPILCFLIKKKHKISVYNVARFPKGQFKYYRRVDRLSCVSQVVMNALLEQTHGAVQQAKVINNPINTEAFFYSPKEKEPDQTIKLVYTGRVHPEKGLDILIKAFVLLKNDYPHLQLSIIGSRTIEMGGGGPDYYHYLLSLSGEHKVCFVDPIFDQKQLKEELSLHDIFCYPSVAENGETFGVAPLEAMATGLATIVSALDCFEDFVKDGENALVFNHRQANPEIELVGKIKLLINDIDLRKKLGYNGAVIAKTNFSTEKIAREYLKDFEYLLKRKCRD